MKLKHLAAITCMLAITLLVSCKPKDSEIQAKATEQLGAMPGITAAVKDGVLTLNGTVSDEAAKAAAEAAVKSTKGVKSISNNITVAVPAPAPQPQVAITADDALTTGVKDAIKDFPQVSATVNDGIIAVSGTISREKWRTLKMALDALQPKKVDAAGITIQ